MDIIEAIRQRHSVRAYEEKEIAKETRAALEEHIAALNAQSGLQMQLITDEPRAFSGFKAHYGNFSGVRSYIAMIGEKGPDIEERCGYYGENIVLKAQMLGLNTCWVAGTYKKVPSAYDIAEGEKLVCVIAIGYGKNQGGARRSKRVEDVAEYEKDAPHWFKKGVEAALLAPTAINQQKFIFSFDGDEVKCRALLGPYSKIDLGIVKYHFEAATGKKVNRSIFLKR